MKRMVSVDNIIHMLSELSYKFQREHNERATIAYLGDAQICAIKLENLMYSATGEESKISGKKIVRVGEADFIGVGSEKNEMSEITPKLVKERAAEMLGEYFRKNDFPNVLVMGFEQWTAAQVSDAFHMSRIDIEHFHGVRMQLLPVPNYIGVI